MCLKGQSALSDYCLVERVQGLALLPIKVTLQNMGLVKITPGPSGCRLSLRAIPGNLAQATIAQWDSATPILENSDMLRHYLKNRNYSNYEIEPKCAYDELETIVVATNQFYLIQVEFFWRADSDSIKGFSIVHVP